MRDDDFVASPKGPTFSKTENFQSTMSSLNYGHVMERAARDYQREMMMQEEEEEEEKRRKTTTVSVNVLDEGGDDDEEFVRQMQKKRLEQLKNAQKLRFEMERLGHGSYNPVSEEEFLTAVTSSYLCVVHFAMDEFERCRILDKHLQSLSQKYFKTRFMKANAPDLPFFTEKLNVKVLPCLILFKNGVAFDRIVGFEELGNKDDYKTMALEKRMLDAGAIEEEEKDIGDEGKKDEQIDKEELMRELSNRRMKRGFHKTESDEDSDFD